MMALWCWCLVGLSGTIFQITWAQCSRNVSRGLCAPSCSSQVLNAIGHCIGGGNTSGWLNIKINLDHDVWVTWQGMTPETLFSAGSGACQKPPLDVPCIWLVGSSSGVVWSPPLVVLVLVQLGRCSDTVQCQMYHVTGLGLPVWSFHAICYLWLHLLGLGVLGRGQSVYKDQLPPA